MIKKRESGHKCHWKTSKNIAKEIRNFSSSNISEKDLKVETNVLNKTCYLQTFNLNQECGMKIVKYLNNL